MIRFIEPSVEKWVREGNDWISHLGKVAAVSRRADVSNYPKNRKRLEQCYLQGHYSVFEHWPLVFDNFPPGPTQGIPPCRRLNSRWYGNLRHSLVHCNKKVFSYPDIYHLVNVHPSSKGAPIEDLRTFYFILSRAAADQLRTYRVDTSYVMESQRYCNYDKLGFDFVGIENSVTTERARLVEEWYTEDIDAGMKPEDARRWLPTTFATRMVVTAPLWKWNYIIQQRVHHSTGRAQDEIAGLLAQVEEML